MKIILMSPYKDDWADVKVVTRFHPQDVSSLVISPLVDFLFYSFFFTPLVVTIYPLVVRPTKHFPTRVLGDAESCIPGRINQDPDS